jgi:aspartate ammonia-lyase
MPWKSKPKAAPSTGMRNRGIQATKRATSTIIGYEKAAKISLTAYREEISLREAALKLGFVTAEQFDLWIRPQDMTHPLAEGAWATQRPQEP